MGASERHYKEELEQFLDVALPDAVRLELEAHLETCEECRFEYESLRWVKETTSQNLEAVALPAELLSNIRAALDKEDAEPSATAAVGRPQSGRSSVPWLAAAAVVVAAIGALWFFSPSTTDIPRAAVADFERYQLGEIALEHFTNDGEELEAYFRSQGISFQTRVLDLGMMNYQVVGGRVQDLAGNASSLFVYEGGEGQTLVCRMYQGRVEALPETQDRRENDGIRFFVYERDGHTAVFWQEGDVVCALVSDIGTEEVVELAFAKAMKV